MKKRCAVFCSQGLGDGLLFLILSQNFYENGYEVITYHQFLGELNSWCPHLEIRKFPPKEDIYSLLASYDLIVINADDRPISRYLKNCATRQFRDKTWVLMPTTCRGKNLPGDFIFDPQKSMVSNLYFFCRDRLNLPRVTRDNGIKPKRGLIFRKHLRRIIIHPTSGSKNRRWSKRKFVKLANLLSRRGYLVVFLVEEGKRKGWEDIISRPLKLKSFPSLGNLADYVYESGYMIGNDSGIGHLASSLGIPTLTIFSSKRKKILWKPDWQLGRSVYPYSVLPNIKGLRWREQYGKYLILVGRVFREFKILEKILETNCEKMCCF